MVQSSRGWDKAPQSGWGVEPSAPSKGKGAKTPKGAPPGPASSHGLGVSSLLPSPRAASPLRPSSCSHAPSAARTSPPLPALVGPGRQLGAQRAPAAAAVGLALRVLRAVSAGRAPGVWRGRASGRGSEPAVGKAPSNGAPCFVLRGRAAHLPWTAGPPRPLFTSWRGQDPGRPLAGAWGWLVWVRAGKQCPGVDRAEAEVSLRLVLTAKA